jgi:hypothetical protein
MLSMNSVNSAESQVRHNGGHNSPHSPTHGWPHLSIFLEHGKSHLCRSHGSQQRRLHL